MFVDRAPVGLEADTFIEADERGAHAAVQHLVSHGHTRIAYVGDAVHLSTEANRLEGWRSGLRDAGIEPDALLVRSQVSDREAARTAVADLRALADPRRRSSRRMRGVRWRSRRRCGETRWPSWGSATSRWPTSSPRRSP
ncbi:substrate-binding domain-containing protein [Microbacterium sp. Se5.02b]|uniref:substrate-binding domain-containing protein n=1 Tax=Microbacterium sp. Se5.02b TaxID=2864103 RepID=UPI001C68E569|nr:substrate-binding domain-containing protein [Microbacterium sp. Se5.02b]